MTRTLRIAILSSLGALALAGCGDSKTDPAKEQDVIAKVAAPANKSWSQTVAVSPDGGYVMGNPDAPIKIVEFASITCSHCAEFSKESHEEIKRDFIDTGRVSLELRNFVRDPLDASAAAIIRCAPVDRFYPLIENTFASQAELFAAAQANPKGGEEAMALAPAQRFPALAKAWKLDTFFQSRGVTAEQVNACLGKIENISKLEEGTNAAIEKYQVQGTPTFVINGQVAEGVATWPLLRDRLRTMGAR
ncbi:thioredoxin domain-containing protein [Sphingopyxis macrogoltabida]|uniref:Protein-disulfide isomerase n=1 Tax=Sphingopyxis macrogoltabida TaxID=33050 RepID=A0AAC9AX43_SPHMC|nr:thioredoxin domain-containing protein [Sphingopyxis macrogoltabida]ALJ15386.1 protein-disulfide isomerase [Sphingopyxis macrogoltabida]AMU91634.1 protein-disulfide isomerase [Sphingopyxis macrogoltabida]